MYETFYQLSAEPFRLSPDPRFCFQHQTYRKAMTYMLHALYRAEGFIMITGRPGTGKTTLINDLIHTLKPDQAVVAKIVSTQLTADDLLNLVAYSFNLDPKGCGKAEVLVQVERFLKQQYQHGRHPLLIVDEAQDMNERALEELRLLTNMQVGNHQLLQIFLVGQEQLRNKVITPSLEQLHQRLIAATLLEPLDIDDTKAYIKHRLRRVNWKGDPLISTEAYAMINQYSQGIPRQINQICSRLFLHGSIEEKHRLGIADLKIIIEELQQEFLLPIDKEGINSAVPCPAELHEETYEEEPQTSPPAPEKAPPTAEAQPETERADQKPSAMIADSPLHTSAREPAAVADTETGNYRKRENPAATMEGRRLSSWGILGLSLLLTGLLLTLVYTTNTPFNRLANQILATSEHSGEQKASSIATGESSHKISEADEGMRIGTVVRASSPISHGPKSDVSVKETTLLEPELQQELQQELLQELQQEVRPEQELQQEVRPESEYGQNGKQIKTLGLEEELHQSGLLTERLNSDFLKVNLSSEGLFDFDSARIKDGTRPALEKLADVLRKHDDLSIQVVGHTDSSGIAEYNVYLSQLRAKAVADYLVSQDLAGSSIQSEGRGDHDTRLEQSTSNNPRPKRRVEIYIRQAQEN
ncbi:MAG: hypothetical protein BMS9Abin08_0063 [Gammaproteobacteria bacterium]|nr:MAG: hypothetical protein BMS9Abin08_0063 [Gammaproteobacteria bacterium]